MASDCSTFHSALSWYSGRLSEKRRFPPAEVKRHLQWLREFGESFPQRMDPANIGQREVVLYFAEHCDDFGDPVEWVLPLQGNRDVLRGHVLRAGHAQ